MNIKNKSEIKLYGNTTVYRLWDKECQRYFVGRSVCLPTDMYDQATGIKIARQKALIKMRRFKMSLFYNTVERLNYMKQFEPELIKQFEYWKTKTKESEDVLTDMIK